MSSDPLYSFQLPRGLLKAMALFQSDDETRLSLFCTCFEVAKTPSGHCNLTLISTDGRRLASYSTEILQETLFGEIPERDVLLLDLNGCAKLPKVAPADCVTVEVFAKHADFIAEKLRYTATRIEAEHGAQFPAWREVIPGGAPESIQQITISHELLADFGKAARLIVGEKGYGLALRTFGAERPITVQFPSHPQFFGIIMPLRSENAETLPGWVRETQKKNKAEKQSPIPGTEPATA
jgi:hypothetical protein